MNKLKLLSCAVFLPLIVFVFGCSNTPSPRVFGFPAYTQHFKNPEDAITPWKPVITTVEAEYSLRDDIWFVIERNIYYEGWNEKLRIFTNEGDIKFESDFLLGPFQYSSKYETILFCEIDNYEGLSPAKLFSTDGGLITEISPIANGYTDSCGSSNDGELFWLRYISNIEDEVSATVIFYSFDGNELFRRIQTEAEKMSFDIHGKKYSFEFSMPSFGP